MSLGDDRIGRAESKNNGSMKKPVSERKRAANRANAQKSTGPRTAAGKVRVSLNALTHGMTAQAAVLPFENRDHFEKFAAALRADLEPRGFLQTLMAERLVDLAWKLRRVAKAQNQHAGHRLGDHLLSFKAMREHGAWTGPDLALTGTDVLLDSAEGDKEAAAYLRLEALADQLQRRFELGLAALRREQKRREERRGQRQTKKEKAAAAVMDEPVAQEEEAEADAEVELGADPSENAYYLSKARPHDEEVTEPLDLTQFIVPASERLKRREAEEAKNAIQQNKATAGADEERPRGNATPVAAEQASEPPAPSAPQPPEQNEPIAEAAHGASGGAEDEKSPRFSPDSHTPSPTYPRPMGRWTGDSAPRGYDPRW